MLTLSKKYYLYRHIRLDKNEPFYIGIGTKYKDNFTTKKSEYTRAFRTKGRNNYWNNIVSKSEIRVEILYEADTRNEIEIKEKEFIQLYGLKGEGGCLVNMTYGGEKGVEFTEVYRKKLSDLMMGNARGKGMVVTDENRRLISERFKGNVNWRGRKHTDESKKLISEKLKENRNTLFNYGHKPNSKSIIDEITGIVYPSIHSCVRDLFGITGLKSSDNKVRACKNGIIKCLKGKTKSYKNRIFKYKEDEL